MARPKGTRKRKCRHCGDLFKPDPRSKGRQRYCGKKECRKASHRASSRKYYRKKRKDAAWMAAQSARVRKWRKENPGKAKRKNLGKSFSKRGVLRDLARGGNGTEGKVLRDDLDYYTTCIKGLVAHLTDAVPDNIVMLMNSYYDRGKALMSSP